MSEENKNHIPDIAIDTANLCREESYTDLKVGTIQVLIPVKPDGSEDTTRMRQYIGQTQIMSQMGPMPLTGPIEAETLPEPIEKFGEPINDAVERLLDEYRRNLGETVQIFLTGGDAPALAAHLRAPATIVPDLVLQGLARIADNL